MSDDRGVTRVAIHASEYQIVFARYYGSTLGRFMSADPLYREISRRKPQAWNRYSYVDNDPIRFVDPDGQERVAGGEAVNTRMEPMVAARKLITWYRAREMTVDFYDDYRTGEPNAVLHFTISCTMTCADGEKGFVSVMSHEQDNPFAPPNQDPGSLKDQRNNISGKAAADGGACSEDSLSSCFNAALDAARNSELTLLPGEQGILNQPQGDDDDADGDSDDEEESRERGTITEFDRSSGAGRQWATRWQ